MFSLFASDASLELAQAPQSLPETLPREPRAAPEGSVRPRAEETTNDTLFEATVERGHEGHRDHLHTISQTKHASKPLWNEATQLMY